MFLKDYNDDDYFLKYQLKMSNSILIDLVLLLSHGNIQSH